MTLALTAPLSPYKGLAPFEDSDLDALLFFGREREIEVIAANLIASRMTVLYGPSGVGKSSVLRAGVAHRLRQERGAEVIVFSTWTGDPVAALGAEAGASGDSLVDTLADAADRAGGDLYVILDQFEECFLYHRQGGAFAAQLAQLMGRGGLRVNVLIGIREDALARLDALKGAIPNLLANRLRLERLDRLAGTAAILQPVRRYNELAPEDDRVEIEPQLEQTILDQVTAGRVELGSAGRGVPLTARDESRIEAPYLQLVLARLWEVERVRGSHTLRLGTLRELGGAEHIVEDHLERAMAELSPQEKDAAAAMYNFLVTPSGTKIAHGIRDLAGYASVEESEAADVLRRLTAERIVRASSTNGPSTTRYEIFHDVLADAVVAWRTRYEGERVLEAERVHHRQRQRRLLGIFAAALIALAVMAAVAVYALAERSNARHQAHVAEAQKEKADVAATLAQQARAKEQAAADKAAASARAAKRSAALANAARLQALSEKSRAEGNERKAEHFLLEAQAARRFAEGQTQLARRQRAQAIQAEALATKRKRVVRAQKLEADAQLFLDEDPEESVRRSLGALAAYRAAKLRPPVGVEDTLREGLVRLRLRAVLPERGPVHVVRFGPGGDLIFVGGRGGARLYDRQHGYAARRLLPAIDVADAAFSPDGTTVVAAGNDDAAHVWDVRSGAEVARLPHDGAVLSVAFSPDGQLIATGSADGTARLWTAVGGLPVASWSHQPGFRGNDVIHVAFSPNGRQLLTVGGNRFVRVFDVEHLTEAFPGGLNNVVLVNAATFSHNGRWIATAGADEFVRLWNADSGAPGPAFRGTGRITDLAFSPDDTLIATAGTNDTIARVWNIAQQSSSAIITIHRSGVQAVAFTNDGSSVITAGRDGNAYIHGAVGGFLQATLTGHHAPLGGTTVSPDGELIATWSDDGTARLWDARVGTNGREIAKHDVPPAGATAPIVSFSPDGRHMLSAGADGITRLWGRGVAILRHDSAVNSAAFSGNSARLITGNDDGTALVWEVKDGRLLAVLRNGAPVNTARLTPDGRIAVTAGRDGVLRVWNIATRDVVREYRQNGPINDAELSRDGRRVVTAGSDDETAGIYGITRRSELILHGHSDKVVAATFSPTGKQVATASDDRTARIWNVASGDFVQLPHAGGVTALAFSPDGSLLATVSADTSVRVWKASSGALVALLQIHSGAVTDVAWSGDGRWLATAGPLAAAIWETRRKGVWPSSPEWLVRGDSSGRLDHLAFSPHGWRLLTGWRSGSVQLYNCSLCGGIPQLGAIARARLREIVRPRR